MIPAHNESRDIGPTCEALLRLTPEPEIIFVDDGSIDDTAEVIQRFLRRPSMKLLRLPVNQGQGAARNVAVRAATGDVVVFVDADVLLPNDFLHRLSRHYENGADYVEIGSDLANRASVYARFIYAEQRYLHGGEGPVGWSQAFSCRRTVALQAGLFPEAFPTVGEDGEFVHRLEKVTGRRVIDRTIVVSHVVPETLGQFWRQWYDRGVAIPFFLHQVRHVRWPRLVAERAAASLWSLILVVAVIPWAWHAIRLASLSERRWSDLPPFLMLSFLHVLAHRSGEWRGLVRLCRSSAGHAG